MDNVHVFESSHSSWTKLFGEPGSLQEHELRGNSKLTYTQKWILEHSEEILNVHTIESTSPSSGFSSLQILQKIQDDLRERNIEPEKFTDRIIFMSMFNVLDWTRKGNDGILCFEFRKIKDYAKRFLQGHWTSLGPGDEMMWYGTLLCTPEGTWNSTATQLVERLKDTGHPVFKSISALSRGILQKKNNWGTIHFNADASNTELLFRIIYSVNQLIFTEQFRIGVNNFGLTEEEKRDKKNRKKNRGQKCIDKSEITSSETFGIFSPRLVSWNSLRENIQDFESLSETIRFTRVCEGASFVHRVSAGMSYKTRPDEDDGFWAVDSIMQRIYTSNKPTIQFLQQFLEEQLFDQPLKFRCWKLLTNMDLNLPFHHHMIQHGHPMLWYPEERVGSWMKLIFPMQNSDPAQNYYLNFRKQKEENLASHSRRLASRRLVRSMCQVRLASRKLVRTLSAFLPAKRFFPHKEPYLRPTRSGKWFLPIHRMDKLCQQWSPKWLQDWCVITIKMKDNLTRFIGTRYGQYCWKRSKNVEHKIPQRNIGFVSIDPELMGHIWFLTFGRIFFHRGWSFSIQSILQNGLIPGGKESKGERQTIFFTRTRDDYTIPQKVHYHSSWKRNQDVVYWVKLTRAQDQGLQFWQTESHAIIVHSPVPADWIYRLISHNGDRILFDRLSTPRPAPKVTLKSNCHSQQQQQSLCDDVSTSGRRLVREGQSGIKDVRDCTTDDQTSARKFNSHNSKSIFEWKEYLKMPSYKMKRRWKKSMKSCKVKNWIMHMIHSWHDQCNWAHLSDWKSWPSRNAVSVWSQLPGM